MFIYQLKQKTYSMNFLVSYNFVPLVSIKLVNNTSPGALIKNK